MGKKIVKAIKDSKLKVQAQIGRRRLVRVTGKKKDDLQAVIALQGDRISGGQPQYNNFRS